MIRISEMLADLCIPYIRVNAAAEPMTTSLCHVVDFQESLSGHGECLFGSVQAFCDCGDASRIFAGIGGLILWDRAESLGKHAAERAADLADCAVFFLPGTDRADGLPERFQTYLRACIHRIDHLARSDYRAMVNLLALGADIGKIEVYARRILGNPMIITDESYKVLAHTGDKIEDPVWESITTNAYSTSLLVEQTDVNNFWARLERSPLPLFVDDKAFAGLMRRAVAKIRVGSATKGYIALLEAEKPITRLDLQVLQMLAEILSVRINEKDTVRRATGQLRDELSADLLTGNITNVRMIENRARSMGLRFGRWSCVLCVQALDETVYIGGQLGDLRLSLRALCDLCIYTFNGSQGYFVLSFLKRDRLALLNGQLENILSHQQMTGILSLPAEELTQLHIRYGQVERLRQLLPRIREAGRCLYPYAALAPLDLINQMAAQSGEPPLSRGYLALAEHDRREGTEYIATLRSFFACNQSVSDTAKRLFLHRNTVNYRLGRIRELLEDDFDTPLIRLHLQLSILAGDLN